MNHAIPTENVASVTADEGNDEHGSGCQQSWNVRTLARVNLAGSCTILVNDANLSQGESERSERSQIEDVTNYSSNVAQGFDDCYGVLLPGL